MYAGRLCRYGLQQSQTQSRTSMFPDSRHEYICTTTTVQYKLRWGLQLTALEEVGADRLGCRVCGWRPNYRCVTQPSKYPERRPRKFGCYRLSVTPHHQLSATKLKDSSESVSTLSRIPSVRIQSSSASCNLPVFTCSPPVACANKPSV